MALFPWSQLYLTGNKILDYQHREILDLFNGLYESTYHHDNSFERLLEKVITYYLYHSVEEQIYMEQSGCECIEEHIAEHRIFIDRLERLKKSMLVESGSQAQETLVDLGKWLLNHILEKDKKIVS